MKLKIVLCTREYYFEISPVVAASGIGGSRRPLKPLKNVHIAPCVLKPPPLGTHSIDDCVISTLSDNRWVLSSGDDDEGMAFYHPVRGDHVFFGGSSCLRPLSMAPARHPQLGIW